MTASATADDALADTSPIKLRDGLLIADRYRIERFIGRGGMGRVFRVNHVKLGKAFALKIMKPSISRDEHRRELFYREARLASSLVHPNIVSVIDFGEDPMAGAYMVMEFLDGESLAVRVHRQGSLPAKVFCDVMSQLAEALHYIHTQNIVHGDIKADNVICWLMPSAHRRRWQIKLLDFGLALLSSDTEGTQAPGGTPAYMAPERIRGAPPHPGADIYSLGILGYQLLTGELPFTGNQADVIDGQLHEQAPPISERRPGGVEPRVEELISRALAKDPSQRHPDMAAFIYELKTVMHMLGMTSRRAVLPSAAHAGSPAGAGKASSLGFKLAPTPMAGINVDGALVIANPAFAKFLTGDKRETVGEDGLFSANLLELHPKFLRDLRKVHVTGKAVQRAIRVRRSDGVVMRLTFSMVPGVPGQFGDVHVSIQSDELPD